MAASGGVFVTCATLGFRSFQVFEDAAGVADAACADFAGETSTVIVTPLVAVALRKDAGGRVIAETLARMHTECSTSREASGWVAVRRLAFHAGRAVGIALKLESWTGGCGKRLGGSPRDSLSRPP